MREGAAIKDFQNPDRVVLGVESEKAKKMLSELYRPVARIERPILFTDIKSAELTKYAANAMLATRVSFMNELSHLCEEVGADIKKSLKELVLILESARSSYQQASATVAAAFQKM